MTTNVITGVAGLYALAAIVTGMIAAISLDHEDVRRVPSAAAVAVIGMMILWPIVWLTWAYRALRS